MPSASRLIDRCSHAFDANSRERGRLYAREGRVTLRRVEPAEAVAWVRGSEDQQYDVRARFVIASVMHPKLAVVCDCRRFEDGYYCKHVFALLLALEAQPPFEAAGEARIQFVRNERWPVLTDAYDAESPGPSAAAPQLPEQIPRVESGIPNWLRDLSSGLQPLAAPASRELWYVFSQESAARFESVRINLMQRDRNKSGAWNRLRPVTLQLHEIEESEGETDRSALAALASCPGEHYYDSHGGSLSTRLIPAGLQALILPLLAQTGRLAQLAPGGEPRALSFDGGPPHRLQLQLRGVDSGILLEGELHGASVVRPDQLRLLFSSGLALVEERFIRLAEPELRGLIDGLRSKGPVIVRSRHLPELLVWLSSLPVRAVDGLEDLGWSNEAGAPEPQLRIAKPRPGAQATLLYARVQFAYAGVRVAQGDPRTSVADPAARRLIWRDREHEAECRRELLALGCSELPTTAARDEGDVQFPRKRMPELVSALIARGWRIDAQGVPVRRASAPRLSVRSGIDWFDLSAEVDFDGESASLPQLLAARGRGETTVTLGDGSLGLLPAEWLARVAPLAGLGEATPGGVRFRASQALLLDAMLASEPEVDADSAFRDACGRIARAGEPRAMRAPRGFAGELRTYQEAGLGWLHYLGEAGLGACLADDMGLGKTVQVLALLAEHYGGERPASEHAPSLVVAPSSVVPNWLAETARFAPQLRVLDFTGSARGALRDQLAQHDLVVTSYGTLRAEIAELSGTRFHAVVLDEAQTIKNAAAKTARAARLLHADRRIALSGTPVENHLGELWSLFDFLNPGLLGASARSVRVLDDFGEAGVSALARALRPFILRRTKQQVLPELPAKTEQTLVCELDGAQRRLYDELLRHYRARVLTEVDTRGIERSKIHVLEALLRLRQAACHPGLIDKARAGEGSAKLDLLLEQLEETLDEGHKALVFSQFTSLLAIVRARLDARGIVYEYLDGKTRDRAARVRRFQEDPTCPVFLISLKAGGLGLNLTAADYVYLLDPWWNPAVEAQAIDRTHRIGQTKAVFAYRLVAKDTIEEKILALQESKRRLADAVISADAGVLRGLTREDLELLLG